MTVIKILFLLFYQFEMTTMGDDYVPPRIVVGVIINY